MTLWKNILELSANKIDPVKVEILHIVPKFYKKIINKQFNIGVIDTESSSLNSQEVVENYTLESDKDYITSEDLILEFGMNLINSFTLTMLVNTMQHLNLKNNSGSLINQFKLKFKDNNIEFMTVEFKDFSIQVDWSNLTDRKTNFNSNSVVKIKCSKPTINVVQTINSNAVKKFLLLHSSFDPKVDFIVCMSQILETLTYNEILNDFVNLSVEME